MYAYIYHHQSARTLYYILVYLSSHLSVYQYDILVKSFISNIIRTDAEYEKITQ